MWSAVATWEFSLQTIEKAKEILSQNGNALDAAEAGVRLVESDPNVESVGRGGFLNADGDLELDGAVMDGTTMKFGVAAGVKGFEHPVTIARAVMEHTPHAILVGAGAERFAREMGIPEADRTRLITAQAKKVWEEKKKIGHDTIGAITLDPLGNMAAATSTSGASMKTPGRVGDSPIIGSGFYVETGVGGAAATGWGEDIMRTCCSFRAVDLMRAGMSPQKAAETVVLTAHETILRHGGKPDCIALVCMNATGEYGGAANHQGFTYACGSENDAPHVVHVTPIIDKDSETKG
jgi:N4-(beta-N-acetylglucosaminyl)-L-asparaginase